VFSVSVLSIPSIYPFMAQKCGMGAGLDVAYGTYCTNLYDNGLKKLSVIFSDILVIFADENVTRLG